MSSLAVFKYVGKSVRVVSLNGEPWFVAKDVLSVMESTTKVTDLEALISQDLGDEFVRSELISDSIGRKQKMLCLSEPALTLFVSRSRTEIGKQLNRWIHTEVLPSIRKNGGYEVSQNIYAKRVQIASAWDIPKGYWCVFHEMSLLANKVGETYNVKEFDLIDGSVGKCWSNYRKGKPWELPSTTFELRFNDRRDLARPEAKAYRNEELFYFRDWLENEYKDVNLPKYLLNKYQGIVKSD